MSQNETRFYIDAALNRLLAANFEIKDVDYLDDGICYVLLAKYGRNACYLGIYVKDNGSTDVFSMDMCLCLTSTLQAIDIIKKREN